MNTGKDRQLAARRMEEIARIVRERHIVRINELCSELDVSPATIRRDLADMELHGQLARVHGGAVCTENQFDEPVFDDKASIATSQKQAIAEAARRFINPNDTIFLDGGSTVLALARLVAEAELAAWLFVREVELPDFHFARSVRSRITGVNNTRI